MRCEGYCFERCCRELESLGEERCAVEESREQKVDVDVDVCNVRELIQPRYSNIVWPAESGRKSLPSNHVRLATILSVSNAIGYNLSA